MPQGRPLLHRLERGARDHAVAHLEDGRPARPCLERLGQLVDGHPGASGDDEIEALQLDGAAFRAQERAVGPQRLDRGVQMHGDVRAPAETGDVLPPRADTQLARQLAAGLDHPD